jgi:hypothetical protein
VELTGTVEHGPQRAAAELAVAGLAGVRNIRDDIEIGYDAGPGDVDAGSRTRWTAPHWSPTTATSGYTPAGTR